MRKLEILNERAWKNHRYHLDPTAPALLPPRLSLSHGACATCNASVSSGVLTHGALKTMEKFSRFNDEKSGVNPFTTQPYRPRLGDYARAALLLPLKAPVALVAGVMLALAALLTAVVRATRRACTRTSSSPPLCVQG